MKILVTGGAGFVGTNLIKRLLKEGHEVVSVDNYSTGKKENHQSGCTYHENDLSSDHILGIYVDHGTYPSWRDEEFDVIYHMAALARIVEEMVIYLLYMQIQARFTEINMQIHIHLLSTMVLNYVECTIIYMIYQQQCVDSIMFMVNTNLQRVNIVRLLVFFRDNMRLENH
jgi:nucleoside-diphosphate-sugar epimerase